MSRSLYPTILFHFTKKKMVFKNIIKSGHFNVSYARETIIGPDSKRKFGIPMVSFCDIRLSQLEKHTKSYGKFGIGLSKEWAERNGLNPVVYMSKGCSSFDDFNNQMRSFRRLKNSLKIALSKRDDEKLKLISNFFNDHYINTIGIMKYMKNYSGDLERFGMKTICNYIFADEREWRYVPDVSKLKGAPYIAAPSNINTKEKKNNYNKKLKGVNLKFDFDDVKYLIVDKEDSIPGLINILDALGVDKKHYSKIMCSNQIVDDL